MWLRRFVSFLEAEKDEDEKFNYFPKEEKICVEL